ncbi:hypothetical protein TRVA0_008S01772 [Trichomonascus vanleenenianus]|uniref:Ecm5p n=1 Tax=Trichomonascus vanleenenianus TaxID=2268995 RepID=UPI003EC9D336
MPGFTPVNALKRTSDKPDPGGSLEAGDGQAAGYEAPQSGHEEPEPDPTAMSPAAFAEQFAAEVASLVGPQAIKSPNPNLVVDTNSLKPNRPAVQMSQRVNARTGVVIVSSQKGDSHHASPFVYPQQRSRALPPLDKGTVALPTTDASRFPRGRPGRPFGLVEAPTLYPSVEQFRDPIRYINSVFPLGSQYGIVKISPPESWMPPFCIDTEMFWFKTRVQGLNASGIEHAKREFITAVYAFHQGAERRTNREPRIPRLPLIDKRPLDLFQLYQCVQLRGGYRHVTEKKLWAQIGRELGYTGKIMTSLSTSLKSAYYRILSPFEEHMKSQNKPLVTDGAKITIPQLVEEEYALASENPEEQQAKRVKLEENGRDSSSKPRSKRQYPRVAGAHTRLHRLAKPRKDSHNIVADPFMAIIHDPNWHHGYPEFDDEDFDFREAATYNLRQFQQKADTFKEAYFKERIVEEDRVEKEFWDVMEDPHQSIQVEYGCDIHTSFQQSGFPQPERHLGLSSTSGGGGGEQWNLNALPFSRYSFGRFIDDEVPQLVRPWMNVGMVFSSKSWHVEDFYSAAVSYHHFGDTRTWYAIPEGYADKVNHLLTDILGEEAVKENPEVFLEPTLFLSPEKLREHGIPCYAVDQYPGQLVVTFPKAYHAHLNHGFNFIEGVNCLPASSWLSYGIECRDMYRELRFAPPFSLEKLALRLHDSNQDFSAYVQSSINKLFTEELEMRQRVKEQYPALNVTTRDTNDEPHSNDSNDQNDNPNEPYESRQCARSNDLCFFSWIECQDTSTAYSLREFVAMQINDDLIPRYRLIENFSAPTLEAKVVSQCQPSQAPKNWYRQLYKVFTANARPSLAECKELVEEGKRIDGSLEPLFPLQGLVSQAAQWAIQARHILDGTSERMLTLVEFQEFLAEIPKIKLIVPEMALLVERGTKLGEFSREVGDTLEMHRINPGGAVDDFEALLERGRRLNVLTPELELLTRLVERIKWLNAASDVCEYFLSKQLSRSAVWTKGEVPTLERVSALVTEGRQTNMTEYRVLKALMYQQLLGEQFGVQSQHILDSNPSLAVEDLEKLLEESDKLPVSKRVVVRIKNRLNGVQRSAPESPSEKQEFSSKDNDDWHPVGKKCESSASASASASCESTAKSLNPSSADDRPSYVSGKKRLEEAISLSSKPNIFALEKEVREVEEWMRKGKRLFGKGNAPLHILQHYLQLVDKRSIGVCCLDDVYNVERMEPEEKVYCICRSADSKQLITCDVCKLSFHTKCLKAGRTKSKTSEGFVCPICDWRVPIPRDAQRPTLEELEKWLAQALVLPLKPEELPLLKKVVRCGVRFTAYLNEHVIGKDLPVEALRHYLCKLEGSDILFAPETNWIRQELHRRVPIADTPPPPVEETQSTRKSKKKSAFMLAGDAPLLGDASLDAPPGASPLLDDHRHLQPVERQDTMTDERSDAIATTSFS